MNYLITAPEKKHLRELAKRQLEIAKYPIMETRKKRWYQNNDLKGEFPMVVIESGPFREELIPDLQCHSQAAVMIEKELLYNIYDHKIINDDKVVPDFFAVNRHINMRELDEELVLNKAVDSKGRSIGYSANHFINDLKKDFHLLKKSVYSYDEEETKRHFDFVNDVLGNILEVRITNNSLLWFMAFTARAVNIMGLERLMFSMIDYPDETKKLFDFILEDSFEYMDWQEKENLLCLDNGNTRAGAGSYGFTNDLPTEKAKQSGKITTKDLWGNMNSQESVGISSAMYEEFVFPIFEKAARRFGLVYYGCCEPVHKIWDNCVSRLENLRKVSISPWCDEEFMGEALRGSDIIYSRKPSPNYLGVGYFDEQAFSKNIEKSLKAARGCHMEILFRDIYTLSGDVSKAGKAVKITRKLIETMWQKD